MPGTAVGVNKSGNLLLVVVEGEEKGEEKRSAPHSPSWHKY